jgi:hypothetical protein
MPWRKGQSGNPKGRRPGIKTKKKLEVQQFFREFFESEEYRRNLKKRILAGEATAVEREGHFYAYGRPRFDVRTNMPETEGRRQARKVVANMTPDERRVAFEAFMAARRRALGPPRVQVVDVTPRSRAPIDVEGEDLETVRRFDPAADGI